MKTTVVCVKVKNIRPHYDNLKEWIQDSNNVYIGRGRVVFIDGERFPPQDSIWANPFKVKNKQQRKEIIEKYREHIISKLGKEIPFEELFKLKGKNLGCWCKGDYEECHGDVLVELLDEFLKKSL